MPPAKPGPSPLRVHAVAGKLFKIGAFLGKTRLHITPTTNANRRRGPRFRGRHQGIRVIKTLQLSSQQSNACASDSDTKKGSTRQWALRSRRGHTLAQALRPSLEQATQKLPTRWLGAS